jgi:hypothetical protein
MVRGPGYSTPRRHLATPDPPPPTSVGLPFLLTDGSVMFQGGTYADWWKLTPDASGSYLDGTWSELASLPAAWNYGPYAFASAVLADGRVLIEGGEYNMGGPFSLTNQGAVYDPPTDTWTQVQPPPGWDFIGDSASIVMPNGKFLLGDKLTMRIAELDPVTMTWTGLGSAGKSDFNAEEGWTLLPDGSFLTVDVLDTPNTERYDYVDAAGSGQWVGLGATPQALAWNFHLPPIPFAGGTYTPPGETGPCMLRPDRTVFCTGASDDQPTHLAHTAIYDIRAGTWSAGPDFPPGDDAGDTSAALLPSGHVLISAVSGTLYEFDGSELVPGPATFPAMLVTLPTGEALVSADDVEIYSPDPASAPDPSWAPAIAHAPWMLMAGTTYPIAGTQFNGLSQAQAFGDEIQTPTNYPLVRITHLASGQVSYARTHDHSSMGVATGRTLVSTQFDVPPSAQAGASRLVVVANGIPSRPVCVWVVAGADTLFADGFDGCGG